MQQDQVLLKTREHEKSTVTVLKGIKKRLTGKSEVLYSKGCDIQNQDDEEIEQAVKISMKSKAIIAVIGDTHGLNGERKDRATLNLPGSQLALLKALKATGKPLIAVLINGKPLEISWLTDNADAILEMFNPGCEGGNAIAHILFGDQNPSGKLTISFPKSVGQILVYYNQISGWHSGRYIDLDSRYSDGGIAVPLYPFGFGLSYTTFIYSNLQLSKKKINKQGTLRVSVDVKNTGILEGTEIVQLYINDRYSSVTTPEKELKGFKRVKLKPDESKSVLFELHGRDLALILPDLISTIEEGVFDIFIGSSSRDGDLLKDEFFVS